MYNYKNYLVSGFCGIILLAVSVNGLYYTLSRSELVDICNCISQAKSQALCNDLYACIDKLPERLLNTYNRCYAELNNNPEKQCNDHQNLYKDPDTIDHIQDCINATNIDQNAEQKKKTIELETCIKDLYKKANCPRKG